MVDWWWRLRARRLARETGLPTDVVVAEARVLVAERDMRDARAAVSAAKGELEKLVAEDGLVGQIDDQAQWCTLLEATAMRKRDQWEEMVGQLGQALVELPPGWTPERVRVEVESKLLL